MSSKLGRQPFALVLAGLAYLSLPGGTFAQAPAPAPKVTEVPKELREALKLDPFYKKYTEYKGYPILSSEKVSDQGLLEARYLISQMLADRADLVKAIIKGNCRFVVMAPTEMTTDVPEHRHLKNDPKTDWDKR